MTVYFGGNSIRYMKATKISAKNVIIRAKQKGPKSQKVSFSLRADLYEQFRSVCQKEGAPMSSVIEEFMKDFLRSYGVKVGHE